MAIADVSNRTLAQLVSLAGRVAVVTGGARGLGRAIAARLAEAGAGVLLGDIDEAGAQRAAAELADLHGAPVIAAGLDVADAGSVAALADRARAELGGLDIWVNNAGVFPRNEALDMTEAVWDRVLDVNLRGVFLGAREAARRMIAAGRPGVIVNVVSTAGFRGTGPGLSAYVASKHGARGLTRQLALEFAPHDIRVVGVAPTHIATEGVAQSARAAGVPEGVDFLPPSRLGRVGVADDIARAVLFCASDLALFVTGTTVLVDAGETL